IDAAIDSFFPVVDKMGERLESLEDEIIDETGLVQIGMIHALKHQLMGLRSTIWPMRDMLSTILREEHPRFGEATRIYLRDAQDHTFQLIDMIETYREIATGLVDIFLSAQSNRMNEVMQVLTLIATIFIPLTFIVGVYGMNFVDMPELHWRWGYPAVLLLMALIALVLTLWFRRKGWLGGGGRR
ncbi:MAG: magnesium/cobalt transporter CorA, partial [Rhodobacteraceae bacterium]|nr:magnesium/cobalt transporter CorA [Paracoccaceae bacterium]